jgi:hypothetical protein
MSPERMNTDESRAWVSDADRGGRRILEGMADSPWAARMDGVRAWRSCNWPCCVASDAQDRLTQGLKKQSRLLLSRTHEGSDGEIEKDDDKYGRSDKGAVVGSVNGCRMGSPGQRREDHNEQKEKHAGDFEPDDSADAVKRAKKSSHASRHAARHLSRRATGWFRGERNRPTCPARSLRRRCCPRLAGRLRLTRKLLSRHLSSKAKANSSDAANFFRLHSDSMVTARGRPTTRPA